MKKNITNRYKYICNLFSNVQYKVYVSVYLKASCTQSIGKKTFIFFTFMKIFGGMC